MEKRGPRIRLLLVEDDVDFSSALVSRFLKRNFDVTPVYSAEEALKKLDETQFEVIVADIKLPGMDGIEFLENLRERESLIPVIFITGYASMETAKEAVKLNAADYLLKPLESIDELLKPIYKATSSYRLLLENERLMESLRVKNEELTAAEHKYRGLFELASDIIYTVDSNGMITSVNNRMEEITKFKKEELVGKHVSELITSIKEGKYQEESAAKGMPGDLLDMAEVKIITKDGGHRHGEIGMRPIKENGNIVGMHCIVRDTTDRRKVAEINRLARLGELAADMAHEVNNPLQIISGKIQLYMMEKPEDKEVQEQFGVIVDQCERAKDIIHRLLLFSKPTAGELKEVNINEVIDFVVELIEHQYSLKNIEIKRNYLPPAVCLRVNEGQIQEVLLNLLKNSADAMFEGGIITITTKKIDGEVQIDVQDAGSGIAEEHIKKIFDPFFTTKEHGTGLGLPVCYGIVRAHGGELVYASKIGEGTTATIILPMV